MRTVRNVVLGLLALVFIGQYFYGRDIIAEFMAAVQANDYSGLIPSIPLSLPTLIIIIVIVVSIFNKVLSIVFSLLGLIICLSLLTGVMPVEIIEAGKNLGLYFLSFSTVPKVLLIAFGMLFLTSLRS